MHVCATNLYGPNDNFNLESSHVIPALIRKFHDAKINNLDNITLWGSGSPMREFLHVDDMADACLYLMDSFNPNDDDNEKGNIFCNIGTGKELSIKELAEIIKGIVDYKGNIIWDKTKPDGTKQKLLDVSRLSKLGWKYKISLIKGIESTYRWFIDNYKRC